ncbi:MAG TPA: PAS domain S-box protein [Kiritimatiellia bacterium]|nr:PAS domain S-box protein [Kiritimatiellia bacterium]
MTDFFAQQWDILLFAYGAAFAVLAVFASVPRREAPGNALPWHWFSAFAALHAIHEWSLILEHSVGEWISPAPGIATLLFSFLLLLEFGRRAVAGAGSKLIPGAFAHLPLLLVIAVLSRDGAAEADPAIRLLVGLPGALLSAFAIRLHARARPPASQRPLRIAAVLLALYGATMLVGRHEAPWLPVITSARWFSVTGLPIEALRLLLAVGLAACAYAFARAQKPPHRDAVERAYPLRIRVTCAALAGVLVLTGVLSEYIGREASRAIRETMIERASSVANMLDPAMLAVLRASPHDERHPVVAETESVLTRAKNAFPSVEQVYLFTLQRGKYVFYASSESLQPGARPRPGDIYAGDGEPIDFQFFTHGRGLTAGPFSDQWGRWVVATVPALLDENTGRVRLALGLDISAATYARTISRWRLAGIGAGVLLILLILDFFSRHHQLWVSTLRLAEAEQRQRGLSGDLERRVHQRTRELADANAALLAEVREHQEAEAKYRALTEHLPAITYRVDLEQDARTTYISPQVAETFGYAPEEWIADPGLWLSLVCEEDRDLVRETVDRHNASGEPLNLEFRMRTRDGRIRWIRNSTRFQRDNYGRICAAHGVMLDVTEQLVAVQQLRAVGERYRMIFEHSPAGLFHYDRELRITELNDRFAALLRRRRGDLVGAGLAEMATAQLLPTLQTALEGGEGFHEGPHGFTALDPDTWLSLRTAPLHDENGAVTGGIAIVQDLSDRRRVEEERMRTQKLESLGLLAGGLAHDFNNILTAVLGNISQARQPDQAPGDTESALADAERAALRARDLTQQLLTFAKGGAPIKKLHDLAAVVREAAGFTVRGSASRCVYDIAPDTWKAEIDSGQITQVIQNLVINADQAMPRGGAITLRTRNRILAPAEFDGLPGGNYVEISISDTGTGIPERLIGRIFDPYFTTKQKGSGLGLTMCYSIVQKHGGHIAAESIAGRGATFRFLLPAAPEAVWTPSPEPAELETAPHGARVLVMDDERAILSLARRVLEKAGYAVLTAERGEDALRVHDEEQKAGRAIDLVILDITVPGGMGGRETLRHLRQRNPTLPALVSSGYAKDEVLAEFKNAGFSGMVPKPYRAADLLAAVREALSQATPTG